MKKYIVLGVISFFCFYTTNQYFMNQEKQDPIYQKIKEVENNYYVSPKNALIEKNTLTCGKKGRKLDVKKTYQKMKRYGTYNETQMVVKEVKPEISIDNYYDKYIQRGNPEKKEIALIFPIRQDESFQEILEVLKTEDIPGTFFIDGTHLERNSSLIRKNPSMEWEILGYQNETKKDLWRTSISYLETIQKAPARYCYTEEEQKEILSFCKEEKLHTILPTLVLKKNAYEEVKEKIENAMILSFPYSSYLSKELSNTIYYLKRKGYKMVLLKDLLSE